jgi:hypothetical protein
MFRGIRRGRAPEAAGILLLAAVITGCSTPSPLQRALRDHEGSPVLLVLPLNLTSSMPDALAPGSRLFWEEFTGYLEDSGRPYHLVSPDLARRLWLESVVAATASAGEDAGFDEAAAILVARLAEQSDFTLVLSPSLLLRSALISGRYAHWDDVSRLVRFFGEDRNTMRIARRTSIDGKAPASSLHLVVLDRSGRTLYDALRGVDLIVRVRVRARPSMSEAEAFDYIERRNPFEDYDALQETIGEVLDPLLEIDS